MDLRKKTDILMSFHSFKDRKKIQNVEFSTNLVNLCQSITVFSVWKSAKSQKLPGLVPVVPPVPPGLSGKSQII